MKKVLTINNLSNKKVRGPIVDGIFYPEDKILLEKEIISLLETVKPEIGKLPQKCVSGIIAPHASFSISGNLTALPFAAAAHCSDTIENIIIIAPVHREEKKAFFLTESSYFLMPTGAIPVNPDIIKELKNKSPLFEENDIPHMEEHAIEIMLPFIQHLFPDAAIVPILIGSGNVKFIKKGATALKEVFQNKKNNLFVVSANMSDYISPDESRKTRDKFTEIILSGNVNAIYREIDEKNKQQARQFATIALLMELIGSNVSFKLLGKGDSYKEENNYTDIVSYGAFIAEDKS